MSKKIVHLINGTHWDREWRHTAEQSKLRLEDLMDNIINILETKESYRYFLVDGGAIVIEDYLTIRPENKERIRKLIESGRMQIVNWYTLPETNTVAPEAMVRNLMLGRRMGQEYGGTIKSGYTATSYGQPSQLPQLYRNFGIDTAIFYRGTNKYLATPLFACKGADGSELDTLRTFDEVTRTNWFFYVHGPAVLGKGLRDLTYTYDITQKPVHMADKYSYEKAFTVLTENFDYIHDPAVLKKALDSLLTQAVPYQLGDHVLAMNMEDNDEPYRYLPELTDDLNKIYPDVEIVQDTMDSYMDAIRKDFKGKGEWNGELRLTTAEYGSFNSILGAMYSSRIIIKIRNDDTENNLINLGEPLASLANAFGKEYPTTNLERAWHHLLQNHAHDSICGAAVDRAHEDMMLNFSLAKTVAEEVTNRSVISLFSHIDTSKKFKPGDHILTLYNTLPYEREEVVELRVDTPKKAFTAVDIGVAGAAAGDEFYDIVDENGNIVEAVELSQDDINIGVERQVDTKSIKFKARRRVMLVKVKVPQYGYRTLALRMREPKFAFWPEIGENRQLVARDGGYLENEYLKVTINQNGTIDMLNKETGLESKNLIYYTDTGETGSAHISVVPKRNAVYTSLGSNAVITMLESNELRGAFKIDLNMSIPAAADLSGENRSREFKDLPISTVITLEKGCRYLKVHTVLVNSSRDHKLCVHLPTGVANADWADVESAWDVARRTIRWRDVKDNFEKYLPFQPMQNFVDVSDGKVGFAAMTKGLREYEVDDDKDRTIKLTLIRTQRAYMTANNNMTYEELDKYTGQHSICKMEYEYALYPHAGDWKQAGVLQAAYANKVPVKAIQGVYNDTPDAPALPTEASFFSFEPQNGSIMVSAFKQAEDKDGLILRIWNASEETQKASVKTILPVASVESVRMDETDLGPVALKGGKFAFELGPHKILSFRLRLKQ
ncbi:MAG: hypothetical protein IJR83_02945 [Clostridia bacterium]|nr:hypothetical protein [Clostridia bacterium]